ncbi:unnamed protein product [marine sediment metagenome]|uniref:Uncharacterized protein n=1 Tax=marine sediment metagenome TaxID=412755 RepID=X1RD09_9ZZZZ
MASEGQCGHGVSMADCSKFFVLAVCPKGHRFAKVLLCGQGECPRCGAENSDFLQRCNAEVGPVAELVRGFCPECGGELGPDDLEELPCPG